MIKQFKRKIKYEIIEILYCDECGTEMKSSGYAFTSDPLQFPHYCPNCKSSKTLFNSYPKTTLIYDDKEETDEMIPSEKTAGGWI